MAAVSFGIAGIALASGVVASFTTGLIRPRVAFVGLVALGLLYQAYTLLGGKPGARISAIASSIALASAAACILGLLMATAPPDRALAIPAELPGFFIPLVVIVIGFAVAATVLIRWRGSP